MNRERLGVGELLVWAFQKLANDPFALVWAGLPIFVVMTAFMAWSILLGVGLALFPIWNQAALDLDTQLWVLVLIYAQLLFLIPLMHFAEVCAYRVIWVHVRGVDRPGGTRVLAQYLENPIQLLLWLLLSTLLSLGALMFCVIPILAYSLLRPLAVCIMVVDGVGPIQAHLRAVTRFRTAMPYYTKTVGIGVLLNIALSQIPIVGPPFGIALAGLIHLKAYTDREIRA